MKDVKMPIGRSYQEYLISALQKDPDRCAGYIEATLAEKDPEHELLRLVIKDVIDARVQMNALSQETKLKWEKLDKMLSIGGGDEIYTFVELLEALGFRVAIDLKSSEALPASK